MDFIRSEIKFVDYVNDRFVADVYILMTTAETGGGGSEYKIYFEGLGSFKSKNDTLTYIRSAVETEDEDRRKMVQILKLGLVRYMAKTSLGQKLEISIPPDINKEDQQTTSKKDNWNAWVFNSRINGSFNGSDNYTYSNFRGSLSAARVTEKLKLKFSGNYSNEKDKYISNYYDLNVDTLISSDTTRSLNKQSSLNGTVAVSISDHWSVGLFSNFYTSTYSNIRNSFAAKPALEYSFFPYKTFTTKYIGFLYKIGLVRNLYDTITWRNKWNEWLVQQNLSFDMSFKQKWGSAFLSMYWSNYFFDWKWNNYGFFGSADIRIVKGLSFNAYGGISYIHDQIELPKGNATQAQVLTRQRILRNTFQYDLGFGLSYQFGSIYNNVVNPRLGEASGFFFF